MAFHASRSPHDWQWSLYSNTPLFSCIDLYLWLNIRQQSNVCPHTSRSSLLYLTRVMSFIRLLGKFLVRVSEHAKPRPLDTYPLNASCLTKMAEWGTVPLKNKMRSMLRSVIKTITITITNLYYLQDRNSSFAHNTSLTHIAKNKHVYRPHKQQNKTKHSCTRYADNDYCCQH